MTNDTASSENDGAEPKVTTQGWRGPMSSAWLESADQLEAMLEPVDAPLFAAAALRVGDRIIDIGCGRGTTTRVAARKVGPSGTVIGVDVSPQSIAAARARSPEPDSARIEWIAADAQRALLPTDADVIISRFGIMFFDDPIEAFANLRRSSTAGGRLAATVWHRTTSPFQSRSVDVAIAAAAEIGIDLHLPDPASGPFAFGDTDYATRVLESAGWAEVGCTPHVLPLCVGGPLTPPAEAAAIGMANGPLLMLTGTLTDSARDHIRSAVEADLATAWIDNVGVVLDAAILVVNATNPG